MFSYLRYFAILCLVLVGIGTYALSIYFKEIKGKELVEQAVGDTTAQLEGFGATLWTHAANALLTGDPTATANFASDAERFFAPKQYAKVTVFSADVTRLFYGSNTAMVTTNGTERVTLFDLDMLRQGKSASRMLEDVYLTGGTNPTSPRTMLQVIVPLKRADVAGTSPQALAEVYIDITEPWANLKHLQIMIVGGMASMFVLIIGLLLFGSWRAEAIIARQHETNQELTEAVATAEAQSREKSQFLASVSHELRTPLNAIIGFSDIIKNEARAQLEKTYQDYVDDIYNSGKHLLSLINDILDYSKAEAGKLQIEWAETDATKIIRNSLRMVLPRAETAQVTVVEDIPGHHMVVVTDAKKLKQVLLNLLSNAVKFTPAGGAVRCHAWEDLVNQTLVIQVRDTGIGIAPKDISKVMQPFGQVDSALSRKYEGTGLGLPLSKKFVEAMGGEFLIESELGVGTSITITVPKTPKSWQNESETSNPAAGPAEGAADVAPEQPASQAPEHS